MITTTTLVMLSILAHATPENISFKEVVAIMRCESNFQPLARAKNSSAGGLWQFTDATFLDGIKWRKLNWKLSDKFDVFKSTDMAMWFIGREGTKRWNASKKCWSKYEKR